jgi:hypothetical protein
MPENVTSRQTIDLRSSTLECEHHFERVPARQHVTGQFATCKAGGMLLVKLMGFIEDQRAEILDVSEEHIVMRLGRPWYVRWWQGGERRRPICVRLDFAEPGEAAASWQTAGARRSLVHVDIRPMTHSFREADFRRRADDILCSLKLHFVAD